MINMVMHEIFALEMASQPLVTVGRYQGTHGRRIICTLPGRNIELKSMWIQTNVSRQYANAYLKQLVEGGK